MLRPYLDGAIQQTVVRGQRLILRIPRDLPRDYSALEQICRSRINTFIEELRSLLGDLFRDGTNQGIRLRRFRRIVADLDLLETTAFMALARAHKDDHRFNWLLERIKREIRFPLPTPVVSALSQEYFQIETNLNLLFVPLSEVDFLLHIPDLYHELAHPLLSVANDLAVEPFQKLYHSALENVIDHLEQLERHESRRYGPSSYKRMLDLWTEGWCPYWLNEFFCDAFAAFTVGPAYGWAHLHLSAKRGKDPFEVLGPNMSHPADDARMHLVCECLNLTEFGEAAGRLTSSWSTFLQQSRAKREPEYDRCYPSPLLKEIAKKALEGVKGIGCRIAHPSTQDSVHILLNSAWDRFWEDPSRYSEWEQRAVQDLYAKLLPTDSESQ